MVPLMSSKEQAGENSQSVKRLTRLQKIITGEQSKAAQIRRTKPTESLHEARKARQRLHLSLNLVLDVPMEVFTMIVGLLSPLDLLFLSRVSKQLRRNLLSKTTRPIWRAVLRAVGAPECPSDINEPQFISLVFETMCQGCGASRVQRADYGLRIRLCAGCYSLNVVKGSILLRSIQERSSVHRDILKLCYFEGAVWKSERDRKAIDSEQYMHFRFFRPDFLEIETQFYAFEMGSVEQKQFIRRQKDHLEIICKHAAETELWLLQLGSTRAPGTQLKLLARKNAILDRLSQMGYSEEILEEIRNPANAHDWRWNEIFLQPRQLTDRIWHRILPKLEWMLLLKRLERTRKSHPGLWDSIEEHFGVFHSAWRNRTGREPAMDFKDFWELPEVVALVDNAIVTLRDPNELWLDLEGILPELIQKFEDNCREERAKYITSARQAAGLSPLSRSAGSNHASVLGHATSFCILGNHVQVEKSEAVQRFKLAEKKETATVICLASALLQSLGMNDDVTMGVMDDHGKAFVCRRCEGMQKRTWKELIQHFHYEKRVYDELSKLANKRSYLQLDLTLIDSHNIDKPGDLAELVAPDDSNEPVGPAAVHLCNMCAEIMGNSHDELILGQTRAEVEAHIRATHDKAEVEDKDVRRL